jgi:hypothetical protein
MSALIALIASTVSLVWRRFSSKASADVEADHVIPGCCGFLGFGERVRVVGVQEDWKIVFIADALDDRGDLSNAEESPLALGGPDQHRHLLSAGGSRDGIQPDEIGDVEMADSGPFSAGFRQAIAKAPHGIFPSAIDI